MVTTKSISVPTNKNNTAEIAPHISSALRDLGVMFEIYILCTGPKLVGADSAFDLDSWYGTQNEQKIHIIIWLRDKPEHYILKSIYSHHMQTLCQIILQSFIFHFLGTISTYYL